MVCNGWRHRQGHDEPAFNHLAKSREDPLRALFRENWLASCGVLFRTSTIDVSYFENPMPYLEWTWLAWRLAVDGRRMRVSATPGFRIHDTGGSASKSTEYADASVELYERMLSDAPPSDVARVVRRRLQMQWAIRCASSLATGEIASAREAWRRVQRYPSAWRCAGPILRLTASRLAHRPSGAEAHRPPKFGR